MSVASIAEGLSLCSYYVQLRLIDIVCLWGWQQRTQHNRKNWLFSQTATGANASAVLYSVIETAKANGLIPFDYLMHVLEKSIEPDCKAESLMPWNVTLD